VAEKKIVELKMGLDKKMAEAQDYYSHLQQALSQVSILRQENSALKDYISKLTNLHQQTQAAPSPSTT
jgi:regulator of replication initiation timing